MSENPPGRRSVAHVAYFFATAATFAVIFDLLILRSGIPALRHDWLWPAQKAALFQRFCQLALGWSPNGLGHPNAYPMTYWIAWPLSLVDKAAGSFVTLVVLLTLLCGCAVVAGHAIASRFGLSRGGELTVTAFLLFNPWVYNKVVAGHLTQIMAYIGLSVVICEILSRGPSKRIDWWVILTTLQIQFFLVAIVLCALRIRRADVRSAVISATIVFSPTLIGLALDYPYLLTWPFNASFEDQQSVPLAQGVLLKGYFPHYAEVMGFLPVAAMALILVCCVAALVLDRRLSTYATAAVGGIFLIAASGTIGPVGWLAKWAIENIPVVGVYRELYDIVAVVACCYALLVARSMRLAPAYRWLASVAALLLVVAWAAVPPTRLWVGAGELPSAGHHLAASQRYALMPPFQPLAYRGRGSGADPLYVGASNESAPINSMLATYPAVAALARYWDTGEVAPLRRLGVSLVECRKGFEESPAAIVYYGRVTKGSHVCRRTETRIRRAAPIVGLQAATSTCSLCSEAGDGNVFFGDKHPSRFRTIGQPRGSVNPRSGWVDARFIFPTRPWLAQPLGGVYTVQKERALKIARGPSILVDVRGTLRAQNGLLIARNTRGYRWVQLPKRARQITCNGECVVVGTGKPVGPLNASAQGITPVSSHFFTTWLISIRLKESQHGVLRLAESYDGGWLAIALLRWRKLAHLRIDGSLNGWIAPRHSHDETILLFHAPTVFQLVGEALGLSCLVLVAWRSVGLRLT